MTPAREGTPAGHAWTSVRRQPLPGAGTCSSRNARPRGPRRGCHWAAAGTVFGTYRIQQDVVAHRCPPDKQARYMNNALRISSGLLVRARGRFVQPVPGPPRGEVDVEPATYCGPLATSAKTDGHHVDDQQVGRFDGCDVPDSRPRSSGTSHIGARWRSPSAAHVRQGVVVPDETYAWRAPHPMACPRPYPAPGSTSGSSMTFNTSSVGPCRPSHAARICWLYSLLFRVTGICSCEPGVGQPVRGRSGALPGELPGRPGMAAGDRGDDRLELL